MIYFMIINTETYMFLLYQAIYLLTFTFIITIFKIKFTKLHSIKTFNLDINFFNEYLSKLQDLYKINK